MNRHSNWPGGVNYGHSNFTGRAPRAGWHAQGGWAEGSENPPGGWLLAIVKGLLVVFIIVGLFKIGIVVGF